MTTHAMTEFSTIIWQKADELYRDMPWREDPSFYHVLVSELMLQQTQVSRVLVKFAEFMRAFPNIDELAQASLADVLRVWQGLGYNRRAKYLHEAARYIMRYGQPATIEELVKLPGVGRNTAGALMNYVYQIPTPYVETNIRTVYLNHFFPTEMNVSDTQLHALVAETIDHEHPREWFWALMDYGSWLKQQGASMIVSSKHYHKQSPLKGSVREVRGRIIALLAQGDEHDEAALESALETDERFKVALAGLERDGLVSRRAGRVYLTKH